MPRLMDMGLDRLKNLLLDMGQLSQQTVATAIEAYQSGRSIEEVNRWSRELVALNDQVGEIATELIARYQPVASDLRYIKAGMEISYGFYRFGRYAHDIMEVLEMFGDIAECDRSKIVTTAEKTKEMIRMSLEAFAKKDVVLALRIREMDDYVDNTYREYIRKVLREPEYGVKCALSETLILRYLERIADHATYIGNSVVYIVKGDGPPL